MKIIKKNQLTILVLALMLVTAGYLNYTNNIEQTTTQIASIGDATLVSTNLSNSINENAVVEEQNKENLETVESSISSEEANVVQTNVEPAKSEEEYFTNSKLEREKMYSQMIEAYQKILNNTSVSDKQKEAAQVEIDKINKSKNSIMISENLIKTKGFEDVVIFINDDSVNVILKKEELSKEDIAQVQNIIAREMNKTLDNIHISNKV